jgi:potassium efflux system protein
MFTGIGEGIVRSLFDSGAVIAFGKRVFLFLAVRVLVGDIITDPFLKTIGKFVFVPIAALYALGLLDLAQAQLTATEVAIGNIKFSVMAIVRGLIAGSLLFWLGGWSNKQSTSFISKQDEMRPSLRQLVSKTIEFMIFGLAFLLLMNIMGINLSALAVLGGAIGVGLGFGLQKIASNVISGVICWSKGRRLLATMWS